MPFTYTAKPISTVLAVTPANVDDQLRWSQVAHEVDPESIRTIGGLNVSIEYVVQFCG